MTKLNKFILLTTGTLIALFASSQSSFAQYGYCSDVLVISIGANSKGKVVKLQNTRNDCGDWEASESDARWFFLDYGQGNAMAAAAMAALALDTSVTIVSTVQDDYTSWRTLQHLSVDK